MFGVWGESLLPNDNSDGNTDDGGNVDDSVGGITTIPFIISL